MVILIFSLQTLSISSWSRTPMKKYVGPFHSIFYVYHLSYFSPSLACATFWLIFLSSKFQFTVYLHFSLLFNLSNEVSNTSPFIFRNSI